MQNAVINPNQFTLSAGGVNVNTDVQAVLNAYGQACFVITALQNALNVLRAELEKERAQKAPATGTADSE